jgi:hypothetical protein
MKRLLLALRRQPLEALLAAALAAMCVQLYFNMAPARPSTSEMVFRAEQGSADMSSRNPDFPRTFIESIHVDLTTPKHWVRLTWSGPNANQHDHGPFHSSPGCGTGTNNCDDVAESNRRGSKCTPKGTWQVQAFSDCMETAHDFKFVTWFDTRREIAFHSHPSIPDCPASSGCVRLSEHAAQLIHNNSIAGKTIVVVDGTWTCPPADIEAPKR